MQAGIVRSGYEPDWWEFVLREGAQQPAGKVIFKLFPYLNFSFDGSSSGIILGSFLFPVK
jgi:hypothetical protein